MTRPVGDGVSKPFRPALSETLGVTAEHRRSVEIIREAAESANDGRSYLLGGLWACRLAAGLTQRELAEAMGGNQSTVGKLERQERGAYPRTIGRLCLALGVGPEDLLRGRNAMSR